MVHKNGPVRSLAGPLRPALILFLGGLPSCNLTDGDCLTYLSRMLIITVRGPGETPIGAGFTVTTHSVSLGDSLVLAVAPPDAAAPVTLFEDVRPGWSGGLYNVEVRAPGYIPWRRDAIRVQEASCGHTVPKPVEAALLLP